VSNRWQVLVGTVIVVVGLAFLLGAIFQVQVGAFCLPVALIALGAGLLLRPLWLDSGSTTRLVLLGNVRRGGAWSVSDGTIWVGVGDVRLDLTEADLSPGETRIRIVILIGDISLRVPEQVGLALSSVAGVADLRLLDRREELIFDGRRWASESYETAQRKLYLQTFSFVGSVTVRQG